MKKSSLVFITFMVLVFSLLGSANSVMGSTRKVVNRPRRSAGQNGGMLERVTNTGSKQISVINSQKIISDASLIGMLPQLRLKSKLPFAMNAKNAPITIELVDRDDFGVITLFVEEFKAFVNVRKLTADSPTEKVLEERVRKEIFRAGYMAMGSGITVTGCAMGPVSSLKALDELNDRRISPDAAMHIYAGTSMGVERLRFASYRQACQEGWAPAPTNDIQKAIWDQVHAIPTKPIKIEP